MQSPVGERYHETSETITMIDKQEPHGMPNISAARVSRRSFLSSLGAASVVATAGPVAVTAPAAASIAPAAPAESETESGAIPISLRVNGRQVNAKVDPRTT